MPRHWQADGAARITHRAARPGTYIPVVNVSISTVAGFDFPQVTVDERLVGEWAAQHLLDQGFRSFGYFGNWGQANYADRCGPVFAECVSARGFECRHFRPLRAGATNHQPHSVGGLQRWLRKLPKPVGIGNRRQRCRIIRGHCHAARWHSRGRGNRVG
jgi:DNA-binding LacI/PurR family transcriptional regulator